MNERSTLIPALLFATFVVVGSVLLAVRLLDSAQPMRPEATALRSSVVAPERPSQSPSPSTRTSTEAAASVASGIYKCQSAGSTVYQDSPCKAGTGQAVPTFISQGIDPLAREARTARLPSSQSLASANEPTPSSARNPMKHAQCAALDKTIEAIDAQARQALSPQRQDQLRKERARATDEKFRLKCGHEEG